MNRQKSLNLRPNLAPPWSSHSLNLSHTHYPSGYWVTLKLVVTESSAYAGSALSSFDSIDFVAD